MDRTTIITLWNDAWERGHGYAPWKSMLDGLTPAMAAWRPAPDRHSIWGHVSHLCFWRDAIIAGARSLPMPDQAEITRSNFAEPSVAADATPLAWDQLVKRLARSQTDVAQMYADPTAALDWMWGLVCHDSYHVGQIMLLRALQGMKPLM